MKLAVYGAGGAGRELLEIIERAPQLRCLWDEVLLIDDTQEAGQFLGYRRMPFHEFAGQYGPDEAGVCISLGDPRYREILYGKVKDKKYHLTTIIDPSADVSTSADIGEGVIIKKHVIISAGAKIGDNSCVNSMAIVGHDAVVGKNCQICSFAMIAGGAKVGQSVFIGASADIKDRLEVEDNAVVSMGAVVLKNVPEGKVAMGNPARIIGENRGEGIFR